VVVADSKDAINLKSAKVLKFDIRNIGRYVANGTNTKCRNVRFRAAIGVIADVTQTSFEDRF
jgi:hypothetical protein